MTLVHQRVAPAVRRLRDCSPNEEDGSVARVMQTTITAFDSEHPSVKYVTSRVLAVHMKPHGASYRARHDDFCSGTPLNGAEVMVVAACWKNCSIRRGPPI